MIWDWLKRRRAKARARAVVLPFRPFCDFSNILPDPEDQLRRTREHPQVRAVMQILERHCTETASLATDERAQSLPGVASFRAGALASLLELHDHLSALADGRARKKETEVAS